VQIHQYEVLGQAAVFTGSGLQAMCHSDRYASVAHFMG